jgi:hypothetical protein
VTDAPFIKDGVNLSFVVDGARGQAAHLRPFSGRKGIHDSSNVRELLVVRNIHF